ncbi:hypothetical protein JW859_03980 [bacterium]|nr:hypothetical protein [bacterium]
MRYYSWLCLLLMAVLISCGAGNDDFLTEDSGQWTVAANQAATLSLADPSRAQVQIPANTFNEETIIMLGDDLMRQDGSWRYFPTVDQSAITTANEDAMAAEHEDDVLAGLVVNTPADAYFFNDITVRFDIRDDVALTAGDSYVVYRFDHQDDTQDIEPRWYRWGNDTFATVDVGALTATAVLPTEDMRGYIGSLAIFAGLTETIMEPSEQDTVVRGRVVDSNGNGVATDVGMYIPIGGLEFPVDLPVGSAEVPVNVPHPVTENALITERNTVRSGADGLFEFLIPDKLIGQYVAIKFGTESQIYKEQDNFDLLVPGADPSSPSAQVLLSDTENLVIWYGTNSLVSRPVSTY